MRQPYRRAERDLMDQVFADPERAAMATVHQLTIAGEPVIATGLRTSSRSDGASRVVEGSPTEALRRRHIGKRIKIDTFIEGVVRYRSYWGWCLTAENDTEGTRSFGGATSGYWQEGDDAVRFNAVTSYPNFPPSYAAWDMLRRLPYERIAIAPVTTPAFNKVGPEAIKPQQALGEGLQEIEATSGLKIRDTSQDWAVGHHRPSLASAGGPVATWTLGTHLSSLRATRVSAGRFYDVAIVRQMPDGSYLELVTPRPLVRYHPDEQPPPVNTTFYEEMTGDPNDVEQAWGAQSRAFVLVQALGKGAFDMEVQTTFLDPRIEDFDVIDAVYNDWATGRYERYRMLIESHDEDEEANSGIYRGPGALVEEREPVPQRIMPLRIGAGILREPWGLSGNGYGYIDAPYFTLDEDGFMTSAPEVPLVETTPGYYEFA